MQKVVGIFMIFVGCSGLGVWYGLQFQEQILVLKELCHVLELFLSEIRFVRCTLPEGCLRVAQRMKEPFATVFESIYERSCENTGESFGEICKEILVEGLQEEKISEEDKKLFIDSFVTGGYEEDIMQLRAMEQAKEELDKKVSLLETGVVARCRLALSLGTMSGLLIIILLW